MMIDANASTVPLMNFYKHDDTPTKVRSVEAPVESDLDDYNLNSIVHQHARDGNVEKVEEILSKYPELINRSDKDGFTALHYAAKYGNLKVVEVLLKLGASADVKSKANTTPLHMSARYCRPYAHYSARSNASSTSLQFMDVSTPSSGFTTTNNTAAIVNTLVRHGANVDAADAYGLTPLHYAAMKGNQQAARALLMNCAAVNSRGVKGMTPLLTACVHGSDDVVCLLLSSGADWSTTDTRMNSVYHITALHGRNNTLKLLLQYGEDARAMLWSSNNEGKTPLRLAVEGNHPDTVRTILELRQSQSSDFNANHKEDRLLLHEAAGKGYIDVVQCLIQNGYDARLRDDDMQLPLHEAASYNRAHVVELLVQLAPDTIEDKTDYGMTPLLSAVSSDALEVVKILIGQNADICATDNDGRTAIFIGAKFNAVKVLRYLLDLCRQKDNESSSIRDLVNHPDHNQMTAMHVVCNNGYIEVSKLLYEYGASIEVLNEEEETPLHLAAARGETVSVRQLLDWDKRLLLLRNEDADTPLHLAAKNGRAETMKVLLDAGADIEARNSLEHTALQCAVLAGHLGTVRQLLDKGAAMENKDDKREVAYVLLESENWMSIMSPMDELPIGRHSIARDTPLRKLIRKYPELAAKVFDKCIRYDEENPKSPCFFCEYDFTLLDDTYMMPSKDGTKLLSTVSPYKANGTLRQGAKAYSDDYDVVYKNHPLKMMAKCEVLLSHPLVLALLKHKWNNLGRYVYYFALAIYLLFLCAYTLYVTHTPAPFNVYDEDRGVLLDLTAILVSGEPECPRIKLTRPPWLISCKWVVVSLAIAQLFKELFQLIIRRHRYISLDNAIECFIYSSAIVSVVDMSPCSKTTGLRMNWQWLVAAVCAFLSWMNLLLLIRKLPRFGIYVVMFFDVLRTFSRFFIVFALFVVAFSIAFFVMMQNRPEFSSVPSAVLKTTVMMIGEFEFTAIFHGDAESHPERLFGHAIAYLIFLFFCVIMTILLMNLLVGLAVDDIKSVLEEAKLKRLSMQADLVLQIEASIPYIRKLTSRSSVRIYPNRTSFLKRLRNRFGFDSSTAVLMEEDWQSREEELLIEFRQVIKEQNDRIRHLQENIDVIYAGQLHAETMIRSIMEQLQIDFQQTDKI
ncbi:hypothetical protein Angca_007770 [Angiostrongylus cantonensis]|nr:hypothetical protein Angca_007770 [Angiostrongylus cantonensis]